MRTLEKHPDVWVAGEIVHPSPKWHLPPELAIEERLRVRELDPIEFVEQVFSAGASKQAAGFKMWYDQNPSAADYVMARNDIKKIVLNGINKLATYSSGFAAEQTGIWNVPITDINTYVPPPLYFSESSFDQHVAHHSRLFDSYSDSMAGDVLRLTYSDVKRSACSLIFAFLGLKPIEIEAQTHRLLPEDLLKRFDASARDRVVDHLTKLGRLEWLQPE
jgi:hypothetical protein